MAAAPTEIPDDVVPQVSWKVRRRHFADRRWLIRHADVFVIDPITDAVWLACQERLPVGAIVARIAEAHGIGEREARTRTMLALRSFAQAELLTLGDPPPG